MDILFDFISMENRDLYGAAVLMSDDNTLQEMIDVVSGKKLILKPNSLLELLM